MLVCLLPVRNGERDLPGWLECVSTFADAVVALDDGSTDMTAALLAADPLVRRLLHNPPRPTYAGWDDVANRNRLLDALAGQDGVWVLYLDADERLDPADATALRQFVERDAIPGFAYGFRVHRMLEAGDRYDAADLIVWRLFSYESGQCLPDRNRLHPVPIPTSIPRSRWVPTTLRIQHFGGSTEERRQRRFAKYLEADPNREFQQDYSALLAAPKDARRWERRPEHFPVLMVSGEREDALSIDLEAPVMSAVIIAHNDEDRIEQVVRSVVEQDVPVPIEIIVVTSGNDRTAAIVRENFPDVSLIALESPALPGAARNAGLRVARGEYISFPGSHVVLPMGSLAARLRAHDDGWAMVTGTTFNGTCTPAGWASYFLDHSGVLPGRPSEELQGPPSHCSYRRDLLDEIGGFPEDLRAGEDTVVNRELFRRGHRAWRAADVPLIHKSPCTNVCRLLRHHFQRGRGLGRILLDDARAQTEPLLTRRFLDRMALRYVPERLATVQANVHRWGGALLSEYSEVRHLVALGAAAAWIGTWYELLKAGLGLPRNGRHNPRCHRDRRGSRLASGVGRRSS